MMPHVMHSVEELSIVKDMSNWSNCNVQFIGKLLAFDGVYMCEGIEKNSSARVEVDFSLTAQVPPRNDIVRIWGELELKSIHPQTSLPVVKVKVYNILVNKYRSNHVSAITAHSFSFIVNRSHALLERSISLCIKNHWRFAVSMHLTTMPHHLRQAKNYYSEN